MAKADVKKMAPEIVAGFGGKENLQMVQDDGQHGKSTQAVNVREIGSVDGAFGLVGRR